MMNFYNNWVDDGQQTFNWFVVHLTTWKKGFDFVFVVLGIGFRVAENNNKDVTL